jgi:hypothetical protein
MRLLDDSSPVLALAPVSRGIGYVVLETIRVPIDWGATEVRQKKNAGCLARAIGLIERYRPAVLILENCLLHGSRRSERVKGLLAHIAEAAEARGVPVMRYSRSDIGRVFATFGVRKKDDIAAGVAALIPELAPRLPRPRKIWESEHYGMALFEAAALAITHFGLSEPGSVGKRDGAL